MPAGWTRVRGGGAELGRPTSEFFDGGEAQGETLDISEMRGMDAEEILGYFYGQVVFTRTPKGPSSLARLLVSPTTAHFAAA